MKRGRGELGGGTCRTVSGSGALGTTVFAVLVLLLGAGTWLLAAGEHDLADAAAFDDAEREGDVAVAHAEADVLPPAALPGAAAPVPLARSEAFADADGRARVPAAEVLVLSASGQPFEGAKVEAVAAGARDERTTGPDG